MRLFWIVCLLVGPASPDPLLQKHQGSGDSGSNPMWDHWFRNSGGTSDPGGSSGSGLSRPASDQPSGPGGSSIVYDGGRSHRQADGQQEQAGKVLANRPDDGEFFTDAADLDPVYSFNSRSRYQRGRAVFSQTRYTPTAVLDQPYDFHRRRPARRGLEVPLNPDPPQRLPEAVTPIHK